MERRFRDREAREERSGTRNTAFGIEKTVPTYAGLAALKVKTVSPRFRRFSPEELATDYVWIVGKKE